MFFNLEYFDLAEKSVHDDTLFELSTIIGTRSMDDFKWCDHIFSRHGA